MPYQDIWQNGHLVRQGERNCAERWDLMYFELLKIPEPFTVLDVGANEGYFCARLKESFDCHVTASDKERYMRSLVDDAHVDRWLTTMTALRLERSQRYDVVLGLSVLHHFRDWELAYHAMRACRRSAIIEVPAIDEQWMKMAKSRDSLPAISAAVSADGRLLGHTERTGRDGSVHQRPLYSVPGRVEQYTGTVFSGSGSCSRNMPRYDRGIEKLLGYRPFHGSLNLRMASEIDLGLPTWNWIGAKGRDRQLWRAWIDGYFCHAMIPGDRGHGPDVIELIAPNKIRDKFLRDSSELTVDIEHGAQRAVA